MASVPLHREACDIRSAATGYQGDSMPRVSDVSIASIASIALILILILILILLLLLILLQLPTHGATGGGALAPAPAAFP